jgi:hypothetical protein
VICYNPLRKICGGMKMKEMIWVYAMESPRGDEYYEMMVARLPTEKELENFGPDLFRSTFERAPKMATLAEELKKEIRKGPGTGIGISFHQPFDIFISIAKIPNPDKPIALTKTEIQEFLAALK